MSARLATFGVAALAGWVGALAGFGAYVNWFSERGGNGELLLWLAWLALLMGLGATVAFTATLAFTLADRMRRDA